MSKKVEKKAAMNLPEVLPEIKKEYQVVCRQLSACVRNLENNYIRLAVGLAQIDIHDLYVVDGYENIYQFAKDKYGISKSTCYNFLGLVKVFGLTADAKPVYSYAQMIALLPYVRRGGTLEEFSPDMSQREIQKKVKEFSKRLENLSEPPKEIEVESTDVTPDKTVRNTLITCTGKEDYDSKIDDIDLLICNAFAKSKKRVRIEVVMIEY